MTVALLFPGQGAQSEGLLHHLPEHTEVTRTIKEASDVLGVDIAALDTAEALHSTVAVQPGLLIAGVATARRTASTSKVPPTALLTAAMARASWLRTRSASRCRARSTARPI